jgi:hypothetical protein
MTTPAWFVPSSYLVYLTLHYPLTRHTVDTTTGHINKEWRQTIQETIEADCVNRTLSDRVCYTRNPWEPTPT